MLAVIIIIIINTLWVFLVCFLNFLKEGKPSWYMQSTVWQSVKCAIIEVKLSLCTFLPRRPPYVYGESPSLRRGQ